LVLEIAAAKNKVERAQETLKQIKEGEQQILNLKNSVAVEEAKIETKKRNDSLKTKKETDDEKLKMEMYMQGRMADLENAQIDQAEAKRKEAREKQLQDERDWNAAILEMEELTNQEIADADADLKKRLKEQAAQELADHKEKQAAKVAATDGSFNAAKGLSDLFFASQLKSAQGNAAEEKKIRKQQFEVDKAFSISRAIMDGIRSVQAALTIPPPFGEILAVSNGILAAANVALIAQTEFNDTSGSTGSAPATSAPSSGGSSPVQTGAPSSQTFQAITRLDNAGNVTQRELVVKAEVVETESTAVQNRVKRLRKQASFP
jgi:hypothetical protein